MSPGEGSAGRPSVRCSPRSFNGNLNGNNGNLGDNLGTEKIPVATSVATSGRRKSRWQPQWQPQWQPRCFTVGAVSDAIETPGQPDGRRVPDERTGRAVDQHRADLTPAERSLRSRIGAYTLHATHDPRQTTKSAREAFLARFEREVDPGGHLPEPERQRRAEAAKKAYFSRLALKSAQARRAQRRRGSQR